MPDIEEKKRTTIQECAETFRQTIKKHSEGGKKVAIFTHAYPDPDAIGSMMGVAWAVHRLMGIECDLFYDGEISHPQNKAIVNLLDPQLKKARDEFIPGQYGCHILVDTIPNNAGHGGHQVDFQIVIDHHKDLPNGNFSGHLIHMKVGSCSSIVVKLIESLDANKFFEDDNDHDSKVATALLAGIITDTEYLVSEDSTEYEFEAYQKVFPYRHAAHLKEIIFFKRPRAWIDAKSQAVANVDMDEEGYAIVGLGLIQETQRDLIADMADEMVQWVGVETAIAFGVVGGCRLQGSVRSLNATTSVSEFCKRLGGPHGKGGGKHGKGAYQYSLGGASLDTDEEDDVKKKLWELLKVKETKRIRRLVSK